MKSPQTQNLEKLSHRFQVAFALFCAKQIVSLVEEEYKEVVFKAIKIVEAFLEDRATKEECQKTIYTANTATNAAAAYATNAAVYAVHAVAYAARAAAHAASAAAYAAVNKEQIIKEQWDYYNELLNFEKNFEEIVLE